MKNSYIFLFFFILIPPSHSNPIKSNETYTNFKYRGETKNWPGKYSRIKINDEINDNSLMTYRLPNDTPIRYDIHLTTDVDKSETKFHGRVIIKIRAVQETNVLTLHYRDITVSKVSLIDNSNEEVLVDKLKFEYVETYEFLKITIPRILQVDDEVPINILYDGTLNNMSAGFYRAWYKENEKTVYYATTQFEATDARRAFPCYDEPSIRAPIGLQIQHDKSYDAYSNMPLISKIPIEETDYVISMFNDTPPMQTYILAFLVSPFKFVSNNDTEIPQRVLAKPSSIADGSADFAISIADSIIKKLENHFGVKFSLPKLDHAAITLFAAGAMENWGLVTYREESLLFMPDVYDDLDKIAIMQIMAHEDTHNFFGNLVSPHWWSDLWLNEGFATLYEYYIPHLIEPDVGHLESFTWNTMNMLFFYDTLSMQSVPMHHYIEEPEDIENRFDSISYDKSGIVLYMFHEALSEPTFTKVLSKYLNKMSFKAATPQDLFSSIQLAYDEDFPDKPLDIAKTMGSWVYQAGYPIILVERNEGGNLVFTQRRYPDGNGEIYSIPVTYATNNHLNFDDKTADFWLHDKITTIDQESLGMTDDDAIIVNIQRTGYYLLSYSNGLWRSIAKFLKQNAKGIPLINRRELHSSLDRDYSKFNTIEASDVLEFFSYLENEDDGIIWNSVSNKLDVLETSLFGTTNYLTFLKFKQYITKKQMNILDFEPSEGESETQKSLRIVIKRIICSALDEDCLNHELEKLKLYTQEDSLPVPSFCPAFRNANADLYKTYLNEVAENKDLKNRYAILQSIGCTLNEDVLKLITSIVEDENNVLTITERVYIISNMMASSMQGFKTAFEYLERNPNYLNISSYYQSLGKLINTVDYEDKLFDLLTEAVAEGFITEAIAEELRNSVQANLQWQESNFKSVETFFEGFFEESNDKITTDETTIETTTSKITTTTNASNVKGVSFIVLSFCILAKIVFF